jgi:ferric-dicitrate binding protein FerR (iron transport regulator)
MSLEEARRLVRDFVTGDFNSDKHASFLQWLESASSHELNELADEYEDLANENKDLADEYKALKDRSSLPDLNPSEEWIMQLERKIDYLEARKELEARRKQTVVVKLRGKRVMRNWGWTAASVLVLVCGGWWLAQNRPGSERKIENPKGSQMKQLTLSDGSRIWLNAASTLQYPASFVGKERVVQLNGEAYFEVAKDEQRPFKVKARDAVVEVMGTSFNVQAYDDEPVVTTTIFTGRIKVRRGGDELILLPGEQATIGYAGPSAGVRKSDSSKVNLQSVTAWKKGELIFNADPLHSVMNSVGRKYNVEISYEAGVSEKTYTGILSKDEKLSEVVEDLRHSNIYCKLVDEGQRIVVMPGP